MNLDTQQHKVMADKGLSPLESMPSIPLAQARGQNSSRELKVKNVVPTIRARRLDLRGGMGAEDPGAEAAKIGYSPIVTAKRRTGTVHKTSPRNRKIESQRFVHQHCPVRCAHLGKGVNGG